MDSVVLRSRRDPAFWVPLLMSVVALAALTLGAHAYLSDWIQGLRELASSDPEAAQTEAVRVLRLGTWSFCALMAGFCAYLIRYFQLGRREGRLPPSGWWSLGALRAIVGSRAHRMSRLGLVISAVLLVATIGLGVAVERLIRLIQAGALSV